MTFRCSIRAESIVVSLESSICQHVCMYQGESERRAAGLAQRDKLQLSSFLSFQEL